MLRHDLQPAVKEKVEDRLPAHGSSRTRHLWKMQVAKKRTAVFQCDPGWKKVEMQEFGFE